MFGSRKQVIDWFLVGFGQDWSE